MPQAEALDRMLAQREAKKIDAVLRLKVDESGPD
jgi:adenylate kinase family enzyme